MRYLTTYEKFKQLSMFPEQEPDKSEEVARKFVQSFKTQSDFDGDDVLADDIIEKYRHSFNALATDAAAEGMLSDMDIASAADEYFNNNQDILINYLQSEPEYIGDYFKGRQEGKTLGEEEMKKIFSEFQDKHYNMTVYDLDEERLIDSADDFVQYIIENYEQYFDYEGAVDDSFFYLVLDILGDCKDNKIDIFREITLPSSMEDLEKQIKDYKGVGNCWSYDESAAEAHSGHGGDNYITLKGKVNIKYVDWHTTFERSVYQLRDEMEIYVRQGIIELTEILLSSKQKKIIDAKGLDAYLKNTYNFDYNTINNITLAHRQDAEEKSTLVFDPPIKVKA